MLTTIGDQGDRTRAVYCRIEAACLLGLDIPAVQSYIAAISYIDMARVELPAMSFPRGKDVLSQAVDEILKSKADDLDRRRRRAERRVHRRKVDGWLHAIEDILEVDQRTVPEPLVKEIAIFLRKEAPPLHRELLRNRDRDAARVLDVLFDAQDALRPRGVG